MGWEEFIKNNPDNFTIIIVALIFGLAYVLRE